MLEIPSALELESLSDSELLERITAATKAIKEGFTLHGDDSDEQRHYRSLITDQKRRKAASNAAAHDAQTDTNA